MSKTKRKRYPGAFKAKVGLEALMGVKTVGQIAREYQVHPVQVNALETHFADRHHPLTSVEAVQVRRPSTVEIR